MNTVYIKAHVPALLVFFLCLFAASDLYAETLTVTKIEDTNDGVCDADCSLREVVVAAVAGDTVVFSTLFNSPQAITLTLDQIIIDKTLTIIGPGANMLTLSGNNSTRIFYITSGLVTINGLKLTEGNAAGNYGGAIFVDGAGLALNDSVVLGNSAQFGGGICVPGGGSLTVNNSTISGNTASQDGGGVFITGSLAINNSTISGNAAHLGGGMSLFVCAPNCEITNSTISGNTVGDGGGGGIFFGDGPFILTSVTITGNTTNMGIGGGIYEDPGAMPFSSKSSIIAGNTSTGGFGRDVFGSVTSQGYNLIGIVDDSLGWVGTDLTGTLAIPLNAMLGPLANNGGPTETHSLLAGSPAINAGNDSAAIDPQSQMTLPSDQRGFLRFYGGTVDIGAYESQPVITGTVVYGNAAGAPTPRFISGVLLSAVGLPNVFGTTLTNGTYTLGGFGSGSYTVTPSKIGGANGISSFDAGLIARHAAGITPLTDNQLLVADTSGNGTVSSFDAGQVARYAAAVPGSGSTGNWIFIPANRSYPSVTANITGEDFIALLMGEVSGNWADNGTNQNRLR